MSGRILMLTSTWDSEHSNQVIAGILERIGDDDIELHIYNAYDGLKGTDYFSKGREIYSLADPARYDGLIIALTTVESVKFISGVTSRFHEHNKPIVSIDTHADHAIFCGLDNYRSMYQLVDHMVTIHDCRTFNYLGGPEDHSENQERFRAFCDCLKDHGITVQKKRVLHKEFLRTDGNDAYNEWKEYGVNMADAVICANDYMALGYVEEASKDGISIPDYMKVTGFDNIEDAQMYSPSITSVNRNRKSLGYEAMDALLEAISGNTEFDTRFVQGYTVFNESCGCDLTRDIEADYNEVVKKTKSELDGVRRYSNIRQFLLTNETVDDFEQSLARCKEVLNIEDIAICLNSTYFEYDPDKEKVGYDDEITMITDKGRESFKKDERITPSAWDDRKVLLFSSLRSNRQTFGYTVMPYDGKFFTRTRHKSFLESLSISLESVNQKMAIKMLKNK